MPLQRKRFRCAQDVEDINVNNKETTNTLKRVTEFCIQGIKRAIKTYVYTMGVLFRYRYCTFITVLVNLYKRFMVTMV